MTLASLCLWAGRFESYLVANPEDRFSYDKAHSIIEPSHGKIAFGAVQPDKTQTGLLSYRR